LSKNENDEYKEMPGYQSKIPFVKNIFQLIAQKRFPEPPLPELFRVSNFKKS